MGRYSANSIICSCKVLITTRTRINIYLYSKTEFAISYTQWKLSSTKKPKWERLLRQRENIAGHKIVMFHKYVLNGIYHDMKDQKNYLWSVFGVMMSQWDITVLLNSHSVVNSNLCPSSTHFLQVNCLHFSDFELDLSSLLNFISYETSWTPLSHIHAWLSV